MKPSSEIPFIMIIILHYFPIQLKNSFGEV